MEKKTYISPVQAVLVLLILRLLFSTSYQSVLNMGNSIQDMLLSLPVIFVVNFIVALPMLILLKRYPGHDLIECTEKAAGRGAGVIVALFYYLFFLANAAVSAGNYENYFTIIVIPDVNSYVIGILLVTVCIYGAIKGIEAIMRMGSFAAVIYILTFIIILISLSPMINLDYLKPLLFNGTKILKESCIMNYNLSTQIATLAFLAPFMHKGKSIGKTYAGWNVVSIIVLFLLEFNTITVSGAYGAKQQYPLGLLSALSKISVFEHLDAIDMVSWILNTVLAVTIYIYLAVDCLLKIGLNSHRKLLAVVSGAAVIIAAPCISRNFVNLQSFMVSGATSFAVTAFTVVIPLIILTVDLIKEKVVRNVQNQ